MTTTKSNAYNERKAAYDEHILAHVESGFWAKQIEAIKWVEALIAHYAGKNGQGESDDLTVAEALLLHLFARGVKEARPRGKHCKRISVFPPVVETFVDSSTNKKVRVFVDVEALPKSDISRLTRLSVSQVTRAIAALRKRREFAGLRKIDVYALPNGVSLDCGAPEQLCLFKFDEYTYINRHAYQQRVAVGDMWTAQMDAATVKKRALGGPLTKPAAIPDNDAKPGTGTGGE